MMIPSGASSLPSSVEELDGRHVARRDAPREHVDDREVVAAAGARSTLDCGAPVVELDRELGVVVERQHLEHEVEELAVQFHDVLHRPRPGGARRSAAR